MHINSQKTVVHQSAPLCFEFLSAPENYKTLMPENTEQFALNDSGGFLFQLKGMPVISLQSEKKEPYKRVVWGSANPNFKFTLTVEIEEIRSGTSEVQLLFSGDFNPMITMMAKKPLGKFIEILSENIGKVDF